MEQAKSRRQFLKNAGRISAAGILLPAIHFASCAAQDKNKLGVALVGLGNYSTTMLAKALTETTMCYLSGVVTGTPSKAEEWSQKYNIPEKNIYNYTNYDEIGNNKDIDIIYVV